MIIVVPEDLPHITHSARGLYAPQVYRLLVAHGIGGAPQVFWVVKFSKKFKFYTHGALPGAPWVIFSTKNSHPPVDRLFCFVKNKKNKKN
jgi:hypothetical protein